MLKKVLLIIISLTLPWVLLADELTLTDNAPKSYVVKKGDTLWDISGVFLQQPWLWPKLWRLNPDINNPHLIYPGDELRLVFDAQGRPMLVKGKPNLKWSPKVRTQLKDQSSINTIPLHIIAPYLKYDTFLSGDVTNALPYILGSDEGHSSSVDGFKLYVNSNLEVDKSYAIYQQGEEVFDPETQDSLGFYVKLVGTAKGLRTGEIEKKIPATIFVAGAKREIRAGDYVMPINEGQLLPSIFSLQAAKSDIKASIVKASNGIREFGKLEVVLINKGSDDSVKQGDVLLVKRKSPGVVETGNGPVNTADASRWNRMANAADSDYDMPIEILGNMMVFKVYNEVSMALILSSNKPLRIEDFVTAP